MGKDESNPHPRGLVQGWRETEWAKRWGWNLFGVSLGTGAVSVAISSIPYAFNGQTALSESSLSDRDTDRLPLVNTELTSSTDMAVHVYRLLDHQSHFDSATRYPLSIGIQTIVL